MGRGKAEEAPQLSLRQRIKLYQSQLQGEASKKFIEVFCKYLGEESLGKALAASGNLQKAFVAAKTEAEKIPNWKKPPKTEDED